ncbi:MAG: uridine monophosphate kinase, partial [Gammaproteobacteria bacterium]|nr:uridine monophosphate kinase [Gammaproteobacteria bacterium]
ATVMNSLAMQDALDKIGQPAVVMSGLAMPRVCDEFTQRDAIAQLEKGKVVICAAGTGNPYFTTDTAGCLRAIEIKADVIMKATKVNGVFDSDPMKNPDAKRFEMLTYDEVLEKNLQVMDATAVVLCRDNKLPLRIFNLNDEGALPEALVNQSIGTEVVMGEDK